jgi:hypothetical protein
MGNCTTLVKLTVFVLGVLGLTSCSEKGPKQFDIVKRNVEEFLKPKMNDPKSYEFIELRLADSILYSENIDYRLEYFKNDLNHDKNSLESQEKYKTDIPSMYHDDEVIELKKRIEKYNKVLSEIDSLKNLLGNRVNDVASYTYIYSFRGKNSLGALVLNEYIVQTDPAPDYKIINVTDDKDKVFLNPNDFPGYREIIVKYVGK